MTTHDGRAALACWPIGAVHALAAPASGTVNQTLLADAEAGSYVLRGYRHADRLPVEREHAVIAYARARGVPAVAPIPLPSGATICERAGRFYALFPRAPGRQVARADLAPAHVAAMGAALAHLHLALAGYPPERVGRRTLEVNPAAAIASIDQIAAALAGPDRPARMRLAEWRAWLERHAGAPESDITQMPWQALHGDFQETNLFFQGVDVSAIIDWDQTYAAPRAWEIARTLHLSFGFVPALCRVFLAGYRAVSALPTAELDAAARYYCWFRAHDLWLERAVYLEGNVRMRRFLEPGARFVPLGERWEACRAQI